MGSTITAEVLLRVGKDLLEKAPHQILADIAEHFDIDTSPEAHDE